MRTKFSWNRMISGWDIAIKLFSKWRPSAILNFRNFVFWSYDLCHDMMTYDMILLYPAKLRVNRIIIRRDIAKRRFSIWRPSAILNLQNFGILLSSWPWKHNLHQRTKFRWNRMISVWDIAIKLFSKWRPSAILSFRNLVFCSCCQTLNTVIYILFTYLLLWSRDWLLRMGTVSLTLVEVMMNRKSILLK